MDMTSAAQVAPAVVVVSASWTTASRGRGAMIVLSPTALRHTSATSAGTANIQDARPGSS
jgi:hypothetical protein